MITLWRHLRDNSGCLYVPEGVVAYILYISTARRQMAWHKQLKKQQLMHRHRDILFCKHTPCLWKGESTRKHTLFQVQWWTVFVVLTSLWPAQRPEIPVLCKIHTNKVVSNVVLFYVPGPVCLGRSRAQDRPVCSSVSREQLQVHVMTYRGERGLLTAE